MSIYQAPVEKVTIGIVNYNGLLRLPDTIAAVQQSDYSQFDVVVADNCSTDGSREWLEGHHPEVRCLCLESNQGPAGARNAILQATDAPYILFLDNDILLERETVTQLMAIMQQQPQIAACHPEICDENDPFVYHYNGGRIHYLGAFISREKATTERPAYEVFDIVSGAALLVRRSIAEAVGGFDEDYFFNWEDGDFVARLTLAGYLCVNVPQATVHHTGKARGTQKAFYMVRNRWFFLLKLYDLKTLILLSPALFIFEISQALLLLLKGDLGAYLKGTFAVFQNYAALKDKHQQVQQFKTKSDSEWLHSGKIYIASSVAVSNPLMRLSQRLCFGLFDLYWRFVKPFCANSVTMKNMVGDRKTHGSVNP